MDDKLKHRIVGGIVLASVAVIIIPIMFGADEEKTATVTETVIPVNPSANVIVEPSPVIEKWQDRSLADVVPEPIVSQQDLMDIAQAEAMAAAETDITPDTTLSQAAVAAASVATSAAVVESHANKTQTPVSVAKEKEPEAQAKTVVAPKPQMVEATVKGKVWAVQVGSFSERLNAERLRNKLIKSGYRAFVTQTHANNKSAVRVRVGPEIDRSNADKLSKKLQKELNLQTMVVEHR